MNAKDGITLFGNFSLTVHDHSTGSPVKVFSVTKKNQITNEGRLNLLHLFAPDPAIVFAEKRLGKLIAGSSPLRPTPNDTISGWGVPVWESPALNYGTTVEVENSSFTINVTATIEAGDLPDGTVLCEAGLVTADDSALYARQIHTDIIIGADMSVTYNWQLGMALQS
jgi:hypothetical protein